MQEELDLFEMSGIHIFHAERATKGVASVFLKKWGLKIDNITWKIDERNTLEVKFPVAKPLGDDKNFLPLIYFGNKENEKSIKKFIRLAVRKHLLEKSVL